MKSKSFYLVLFLVILLGFMLRIHHLDTESLWFDESFTMLSVEKVSFSEVVRQANVYENKPSTYYVFLHFWSKIFGLSVFALRLFSVIVGTISIFLIYFLGKNLFDRNVAILSSIFLSISLFDVLYSQEIRVFALFTTAVLISVLIFVVLVKRVASYMKTGGITRNLYFWLFFANVFLNSIHYFSWLVIITENIIFFKMFKDRRIREKWIFYQVLTSLFFIFFLPKLVSRFFIFNEFLINVFVGKWGIPLLFAKLGIVLFILPLIGLICCVLFLVRYWDRICSWYERANKFPFLLLILSYYLFTLFYIEIFYSPFFLTRYGLFLLPLVFIIFAKVIVDLPSKIWRPVTVLIILVLSIVSLSIYYQDTTKEEWDEVASFISAQESIEEIIYFDVWTSTVPFSYYYGGGLSLVGLNESNRILKLNNTRNSFWLVLSHNRETIDHYETLLPESLYLDKFRSFKGVEVYHYSTEVRK